MRIGIDGFPLTIPFACGSLHYAKNLITGLAEIDKQNDYYIFISKPISVFVPKQSNFHIIRLPNIFPIFKHHLLLSYAVRQLNIDVYHFLEPHGSLTFNHKKIVSTVHDLDLNQTYRSEQIFEKAYTHFIRQLAIKRSRVLITDSINIKKELTILLRENNLRAKIYNISLAADLFFKFGNSRALTKINDNYFLGMGDFSPRKNLLRVLQAYALLLQADSNRPPLYILISDSAYQRMILKKAQELKINRIKIFSNISQKNVRTLYSNALCFLYPSLYEGFGLPILEAMSCGCPVITSNYGTMRETSGKAAYLVNPKSPESIYRAMFNLMTNKKLTMRLRLAGINHSQLYSWKKTALQTLGIYKKIYNE